MWESTPWQYFTATIVSFNSEKLQYKINWDDQDPTGRIIDYYNLALDRVPEPDEVAIGSIVLFPQGKYRGQEGVRLGGLRYHQVCVRVRDWLCVFVRVPLCARMLFFSLHFCTVLHCHIFARCQRSVAQLWWTCVFLEFRVIKMKYDSKRRDSTEEWKKKKTGRFGSSRVKKRCTPTRPDPNVFCFSLLFCNCLNCSPHA